MSNWDDSWLRACAVCGYMLLRITQGGEQTYAHKPGDGLDHPAVPVDITEIHTIVRCDFCSTEGAIWTLPVEDYDMGNGIRNRGDWAACNRCADFLERGSWVALADRAYRLLRQAPRSHYAKFFRQLRGHVIGTLHLETRPGLTGSPEGHTG